MLLEVADLAVAYGDVRALWDISLHVDPGEIVVLIGSNGAGKTTLMRAIAGLQRPLAGTISFEGVRLDTLPPHALVERGIVLVPEGRRLFGGMTVLENLELGAYTPRARQKRAATIERVFALFPLLAERKRQPARTLSGGQQQMLAIGRALMTRPRLLMLDEPSQGIMPKLVDEIFQAVKRIRDAGMTVLIVEQRMAECLEIADRAYILQTGRVLMQGSAAEISVNPDVRKAYLGL
jgi:branched-chain amino acid transport system ATP-binding protein